MILQSATELDRTLRQTTWSDRRTVDGQVLALICPECACLVPPIRFGGLTQIDFPGQHIRWHVEERHALLTLTGTTA